MSWNKRAARDVNELISRGYKVYSEKGEGEEGKGEEEEDFNFREK